MIIRTLLNYSQLLGTIHTNESVVREIQNLMLSQWLKVTENFPVGQCISSDQKSNISSFLDDGDRSVCSIGFCSRLSCLVIYVCKSYFHIAVWVGNLILMQCTHAFLQASMGYLGVEWFGAFDFPCPSCRVVQDTVQCALQVVLRSTLETTVTGIEDQHRSDLHIFSNWCKCFWSGKSFNICSRKFSVSGTE
jgi:hypothetical protein